MARFTIGLSKLLFILLIPLSRCSLQPSSPVPPPLHCAWTAHGRPFLLDLGTCPQPIDEATVAETGSHSPWTVPPHCINQPGRPASGPQFCIFTSRTFRNGRGISILTAPELAASVADVLDDSVVAPAVASHPSSPLFTGGADGLAYRVVRIPGAGKGMVAARAIKRWDVVLVDFPAMITLNEYSDMSKPSEIRRLLERGVEQLPEVQKERVLSLAYRGQGELIRDILRTNVFGGIELGGVPHIALFPIGSRVNHNCKPNTFWRYDPKTLAQEVVALRDIEPGEQITHSYAPLGLVYLERKAQLDGWGFGCTFCTCRTCALCSAPERVKLSSDQRRNRLHDIHLEMQSAQMEEKRMDDMTDELTYLIEKEKIWPLFCEYYVVVSRAWIRFNKLEKATSYAQIADNTWHDYGGENHENVEGMMELWEEIDDLAVRLGKDRRKKKSR